MIPLGASLVFMGGSTGLAYKMPHVTAWARTKLVEEGEKKETGASRGIGVAEEEEAESIPEKRILTREPAHATY